MYFWGTQGAWGAWGGGIFRIKKNKIDLVLHFKSFRPWLGFAKYKKKAKKVYI
jgi:hypothetical protein